MSQKAIKIFAIAALLNIMLFSVVFAEEFRYDSHGKRDPFSLASASSKVGSSSEKGSVTHIKIEGVVMDPKGRSIAIVNGEMVGEGDRVGGVVLVKKITKKGVEFENNGQVFTIPIVNQE